MCAKVRVDTDLKDVSKMCLQIIYLIYMFKEDLALSNLQYWICHKTKPNRINEGKKKEKLINTQKHLMYKKYT